MDVEKVAKFHDESAACWRAKNQPELGAAHESRATAIRAGALLTASEEAGSEYGMWADVAENVARSLSA